MSTQELEGIYDDVLKQLPSRAPIYLPTERIGLVDRILGARHVRKIYKQDLDAVYRPRLRALREKYKNHKRCFLIGNGPSLNRTDLSALRDEVTFAVNGFFLKARDLGWKPTFYIVEDHLVAEDRAAWINRFDGPIKLFPAYLGYVFPESEDTIFYNHRPRKSYPHGFDFSLEADKITYTGCTVTFSMMQLAAYLGFEEIYLIGVDASYDIPPDALEGKDYSVGVLDMKSDDPNHFDPNYFGKGFRWHDPQVEKMIQAYEEARRTLEGTNQRIINATVGGMLEVFERRSFQSVLPAARSPEQVEADNAALAAAKHPRLLILDMTALGNGTATGDLKATLLEDWPADRLLQIARHGKDGLQTVVKATEGYATKQMDAALAAQAVEDFAPDVILYRPVPNVPWLHQFAKDVIYRSHRPLITWIMDDWPEELRHKDAPQWKALGYDFRAMLRTAAVNLSICDKMSDAFAKRYSTSFEAIANGVNPVHWPALRQHEGRQLKLRYSGGLAKNMTLDSVLRVAHVVERLAEEQGYDISFEISTQAWWHKASAELFSEFKHTTIDTLSRSAEEYRKWLSEADAVLIAYNHDEETLRYVRYSMANKMPECLASGAVVLVHGPRDVATVDYLASTDAAVVVTEPDATALEGAIIDLLENPDLRNRLARRAREIAFDRHGVSDIREKLRRLVVEAASASAPIRLARPFKDYLADLVEKGEAPTRVLTACSAYLILEPAETTELIQGDAEIRDAIDDALAKVHVRDQVRRHFERTLAWGSKGGGEW